MEALAQWWSAGATISSSVWQLVLLWIAGAFIGWLLPRPKTSPNVWTALFSSTAWRRVFLAWHGALIMREVWYKFTEGPGTARRLFAAVVRLLAGNGWSFDFPTSTMPGTVSGTPCDPKKGSGSGAEESNWYVNSGDLNFFKQSIEASSTPSSQAGPWEQMMDREIPGVIKYTAWRRTLANGKTEYKSITYNPDATAEEFMDMYLDDDNRPNWDTMIVQHECLEHGDFSQRQQVVRWIRRFPFSFISDREYVIAKRLFRSEDSLYGITKAIDHPRAKDVSDVVRMDVFYSMWRSRTVPCPWNSGAPACETVLLHHEQFKIPENLGRFAVKHGMWGFVRKLSTETPKFIEARRKRCEPYKPDPQAYGAGFAPNPPCKLDLVAQAGPMSPSPRSMRRTDTSTSGLSSLTTQSSTDLATEGDQFYRTSGSGVTRTKSGKLRGMAAFALASGLAVILHKSASSEKLPGTGKLRRTSSTARNIRRTCTSLASDSGITAFDE